MWSLIRPEHSSLGTHCFTAVGETDVAGNNAASSALVVTVGPRLDLRPDLSQSELWFHHPGRTDWGLGLVGRSRLLRGRHQRRWSRRPDRRGTRSDDDGSNDVGEAYVVFGKASGFGIVDGTGRAVIDIASLAPAEGFIIQGDYATDSAGYSVSLRRRCQR